MIWSIISVLTGNLIGRDHCMVYDQKIKLKKKEKNKRKKNIKNYKNNKIIKIKIEILTLKDYYGYEISLHKNLIFIFYIIYFNDSF